MRDIAFKIVLGIAAVAHIFQGVVGIIPAIPVSVAVRFYGATLQLNPQVEHILRILGAYMFVIGVLASLAVFNPTKNKSIIWGIVVLLLVRVLQRVWFAPQSSPVFEISPVFYWSQTVFFLATAIALVLLRPKGQ